ncbi:hypothetical protein [Nocardia nova]
MTSTDATAALAIGPDIAAAALRWMHEGDLLIAYGFADSPSVNHWATHDGEAAAYSFAARAFDGWAPTEVVRMWFIDWTGQIRHQAAGTVTDVHAAAERWPHEAHRFPRTRRAVTAIATRARAAARRHREPLTRSVLPVLLLALVGLATAAALALAPHHVSVSLGSAPATAVAAPHADQAAPAPAAGPDCVMLCDHPAPAAPDHSTAGGGCIMLCSADATTTRPTTAVLGAALHRLA